MRVLPALLFILLPLSVFAEKPQLPFVFLNQYFEYDVSEGPIYKIGGQSINWGDRFAQITDNKLVIDPQPVLKSGLWNLSVRNLAGKIVFEVKDINITQQSSFILPTVAASAPALARVCLSSRNAITQYLMCKSLVPVPPPASEGLYPQVFIGGKAINKFGRVILNQPKKSILFEVKVNELESIKLTTRKRLIVPSTVKKNIERKDYQIKFIDLELDNYSWEASIGYEQEAFRIPNDSLVTVYQDYFNKDSSNKEVDLTYYTPPYKRMRIRNMYSFSPFFGFSKFEGNTRTKNASILSEYDVSLRMYLMRQFPKDMKWKFLSQYFHFWTASTNLRSVKYISNVNSVAISNPGGFLYNISGSLNRAFNDRLSYAIRAAVEKNTSLEYSSSSTQVTMDSVLNKEIGLQGTVNLYDQGRFVSFMSVGYSWLLPVSISGSDTQLGSRVYFRSDVHYADGNKLYGVGFHYNLRQQETSLQRFKDQSFDYTASYSVAF